MSFLTALVLLVGWSRPTDAAVSVKTFKFRPDTVVVRAGAAVSWTNEDEIEHTVTADSAGGGPPALRFDGTLATKSKSLRVAFPKPGVYAYHCARHTFMTGVVRVTTSGATK